MTAVIILYTEDGTTTKLYLSRRDVNSLMFVIVFAHTKLDNYRYSGLHAAVRALTHAMQMDLIRPYYG